MKTERAFILRAVVVLAVGCTSNEGGDSSINPDTEYAPEIQAFQVLGAGPIGGSTFTFRVGIHDADGDPLACLLDFDGDGVTDETIEVCSTGDILTRTFAATGTWTAQLTVSDGVLTDTAQAAFAAPWDPSLVSLQLLAQPEAMPGHIISAAWSPDRTRVAYGTRDYRLHLWDVAARVHVMTLDVPDHGDAWLAGVVSLAWSPDGETLFGATGRGWLYAWDADTLAVQMSAQIPDPDGEGVDNIALSPNGEILAVVIGQSHISLYAAQTLTSLSQIYDDYQMGPLAFHPDGTLLSWGGSVWDITQVPAVNVVNGSGSMVSSFSPDGQLMVMMIPTTTSYNTYAYVYDVETWTVIDSFTAPHGRFMAWSPDGSLLAAERYESNVGWSIAFYDPANSFAKVGPTLSTSFGTFHKSLAWAADGSWIAAVAGGNPNEPISLARTRVWTAAGAEMPLIGASIRSNALDITADGSSIARADEDGVVRVARADASFSHAFFGHTGPVHDARFSPDGTRLATADDSGTVRVWTSPDVAPLQWTAHTGAARALAWSADSQKLASGGADGVVSIRDAATGGELESFVAHPGGVNAIDWAGDGRILTGGDGDSAARVWDSSTGLEISSITGSGTAVLSVAWSPDGSRGVFGGPNGARVFEGSGFLDVESSESVPAVAWNPLGTKVAFVTADPGGTGNRLSIFDATTGAALAHAPLESLVPLDALAWTADGHRLVSNDIQGRLRVWTAGYTH